MQNIRLDHLNERIAELTRLQSIKPSQTTNRLLNECMAERERLKGAQDRFLHEAGRECGES